MPVRMLALLLLVSCPAKDKDEDPATCGSGDCVVTLGTGAPDGTFFPFEGTPTVPLDVAPQGGLGIAVYASTTGLKSDEVVSVLLVPKRNGKVMGSFLDDARYLYCQNDGTGLVWGITVGFDPDEFVTNDDFIALDGEQIELSVTVTDMNGEECTGTHTVQLEVGR